MTAILTNVDTDDETDRRSSEMSEAYLTNWLSDRCSTGSPSHFHDVALREARIASEHHESEPRAQAQEGFLTRLRFAFTRPSADACNCPA